MTAIELDASQRAAVEIAPGDRQLVFAGPGAGKSEVVGAIAAHLVSEGEIYPEEILIISFSRAAVDVVRRRTKEVVDEGRGVEVSTIDSLAARLLLEHGDEDRPFSGYEQSIKDARKLITASDTALLDHVRHVIIDEVQDIVGARAEFVLALLARAVPDDTGYTLLGDPLQSLYDFQLSSANDVTSKKFLDTIRLRWAPIERHLTGEYRSCTDDARRTTSARQELLALSSDQRVDTLRRLEAELAPLGELDASAASDIAAWSGSTVLLCDTNARAGLVSDRLAVHGCPSRLAASALDPGIPAWVAILLGERTTGVLRRDAFANQVEQLDHPDPDEIWWKLLRLAPDSRGIDLDRLITRLADPRQAAVLQDPDPRGVVTSTVHRAKGLEFDNVVLVDPQDWEREDRDAKDLAGMLYVALTRGRHRVTLVNGVPTRGWSQFRRSREPVWVCRGFRGKGFSRMIMEPKHARALGPVDHDLSELIGAQLHWHQGDDHVTVDEEVVPSWTATADGRAVARTGIEFGKIMKRLRFNSYGPYPDLSGGRLEGLETVVDPGAAAGRRAWIGARVTGPLKMDWSRR